LHRANIRIEKREVRMENSENAIGSPPGQNSENRRDQGKGEAKFLM